MKINTNYQLNNSKQSNQNFGSLLTSHPNKMAEILDNPTATREVLGTIGNLEKISDTVDTLAFPINDNGRPGMYLRVQKIIPPFVDSKIPGWKTLKRVAYAIKILLTSAKTKTFYHDEGPLGRNVLEQAIAFKKTLQPNMETALVEIEQNTMPIEEAVRSEWRGTVC